MQNSRPQCISDVKEAEAVSTRLTASQMRDFTHASRVAAPGPTKKGKNENPDYRRSLPAGKRTDNIMLVRLHTSRGDYLDDEFVSRLRSRTEIALFHDFDISSVHFLLRDNSAFRTLHPHAMSENTHRPFLSGRRPRQHVVVSFDDFHFDLHTSQSYGGEVRPLPPLA